jgi:hypothetical protein
MPHPTWLAAFPEKDIIFMHHLHIQEKEKEKENTTGKPELQKRGDWEASSENEAICLYFDAQCQALPTHCLFVALTQLPFGDREAEGPFGETCLKGATPLHASVQADRE